MEFNILALTSAIAHAGLIWYGKWQDDHAMVKYTDIDYWVLADAARAVYNLKSPYTRATYRYTPILAWLLLPNEIFGEWYGKALFSGFDLVASFFIYSLLRAQMVTKRSAVVITAILYALNPIVLIVSTRGNAESIICTLCLAFIWTLAKGRRLTSAVILGLAIHVKIFPLIYLPTVLVFMGLFPNTSFATSRSVQTPQTPVKDFKSPCPSAIQGTPVKGQQLTGRQKMIDLKWKHVQYVLTVFLTVTVLTGMTYILYGKQAIDESIIYHLTRRDHRHNFSPYWLMFYHNVSLKWPDWILSLIPFIPQALLTLAIALVYGRRDFCFAIFLQTFLFVSLNKVCTSQV